MLQDPKNLQWANLRSELDESASRVFMGATVPCVAGKHLYPPAVFACSHILVQNKGKDTLPDGIVLITGKYYMCFKCFRDFEAGKLNLQHITVQCRPCIEEEVYRLMAIKKTLFKQIDV